MKGLKAIYFAVYALLILILILLLLRKCQGNETRHAGKDKDTIATKPVDKKDTTVAKTDTIARDSFNKVINPPDSIPQDTIPPARRDSIIKEAKKIGQSGDLKITLQWDFPGDIDLHVKEPSGNEIYYNNKSDRNGVQVLDVDNTRGGRGAAENAYWRNPDKGKYQVRLHYYSFTSSVSKIKDKIKDFFDKILDKPSQQNNPSQQNSPSQHGGDCRVIIFQKGQQEKIYTVRMTTQDQMEYVTTVEVP